MKEEIVLLEILTAYYEIQHDVAWRMREARQLFSDGDEVGSWLFLFAWWEAKDERAELWEKLRPNTDYAHHLKEGWK